ncbi:hypothetical protein KBZ08_12440 [Cyanobium sp. Candia 9D4]|uniref:hypothetical protein n=1 Tax=Cyanobium sp. Candia 9D4 TaxID=2823707 RepID=UPI0020CFBCBB|nr:hypothetical protein [Cyanobium sp. Candia 9D4]MCP9934723.1 hypothetical protein [Cyanobium sp. Candia 9D4]
MITPPLLVRWYGTLATIAALLATQAILLPRWPAAPRPLPAEQLEAALRGAQLLPQTARPSLTPPWPAKRSYELATSAPVVLPLRDGYELTLVGGAVRQRFNFQAGAIGRDHASLKLRQRRLLDAPVPTARGLAQDRPTLQTCLVAGPGLAEPFGVTREQLTTLADRLAVGRQAALERVIGLQPNRSYACTLISLRGAKGKPPSDRLWQQVLDLVEPVLRIQT